MSIPAIQTKTNDPLYVLILWHMHQPIYKDLQTKDFLLPWVRLHALKDYYDMVDVVEPFPDVHLTFNLVPSLVEQILDYVERGGEDSFLALSRKKTMELTPDDKIFLLKNFFSLNFDQMIQPFPRYKELFEKRGNVGDVEKLQEKIVHFSVQDFRDLQVWFNLAWSGNCLKNNREIKALIWKGRNFTEEEKLGLLEHQLKFMAEIIPVYKRARERGQIEVSTSPYYHPIMPLLNNINSAREALPNIDLPNHDFHYSEDVVWHVQQAIHCYERQFGEKPAGMWPSEGALSEEILPLLRQAGIRWVATDEEILHASLRRSGLLEEGGTLKPERKYTPYVHPTSDGPMEVFFRDHLLSDMIGFTYSTYDGEAAAQDMISRLLLIRKMLPADTRHYAVPIILDGENAWEYYPDNGACFLKAFYGQLQANPYLRAVTFSEYLSLAEPHPEITKLRAGSWIYGSFSTWVGHPEKNRAWDLLAATRKKLAETSLTLTKGGEDQQEAFKKAHREVMIAEGSDWFWWYGEDHFSEYDREFDQLFRRHLQRAWECLGLEPPPELADPIIQKVSRYKIQRPFELLTPILDGHITDYFEWLAAGYFSNQYSFTTMQRVHHIFHGFYFGFDHNNFYIRLDVDNALLHDKKFPFIVEIIFRKPGNVLFRMVKDNQQGTLTYDRITLDDEGREAERCPIGMAGAMQIVELGVPLEVIGIHENQVLEFGLRILIDGNLAERMPHDGFISQKISIDDLEKYYWVV